MKKLLFSTVILLGSVNAAIAQKVESKALPQSRTQTSTTKATTIKPSITSTTSDNIQPKNAAEKKLMQDAINSQKANPAVLTTDNYVPKATSSKKRK